MAYIIRITLDKDPNAEWSALPEEIETARANSLIDNGITGEVVMSNDGTRIITTYTAPSEAAWNAHKSVMDTYYTTSEASNNVASKSLSFSTEVLENT